MKSHNTQYRSLIRRSFATAVGAIAFSWMPPVLAEDEVKVEGYDSLPNTSRGWLVRGMLFDLEVTAENPITIDEIRFFIRGNNASTWDFELYFREGSVADVIDLGDGDTLPVHRVEEEWELVGQAPGVESPPSNQLHPMILDLGPAEDGGLELTEGRYTFYFSGDALPGSASNNGLRVTAPADPPDGVDPFYEPLSVFFENADFQLRVGGSKGSLFGTTNPFSNLRMFNELEFVYRGGDDLEPPPPLPTPEDVTVDSTDFAYTQDFNSLGDMPQTWVNSGTLPGWHIYIGDDASFSMDGRTLPAAAAILRRQYLNFGFTEDERAIGATAGSQYSGFPEVGSIAVDDTFGFITLALVNETDETIDSLALSYDGLQFELGNSSAGPQDIRVGHATTNDKLVPADPAAWTEVPEANFTSPRFTTEENPDTGFINPFQPENRANRNAGDLTGLDWQPGDTLWIRWLDFNEVGGDHGLLIDNVSLNLTQSLFWNGGTWGTEALGGSGVWEDGAGEWNPDRVAVFDGTGGTINLGTVTVGKGLRFLDDYTLDGGSLTLAGTLDSENVLFVGEESEVEIASPLVAPNGFAKTGDGTLMLGDGNSIGGRSAIHAGRVVAMDGSLGGEMDVRGLLEFADDADYTVDAALSGSGEMIKLGDGMLSLTDAGSFTGTFRIEEGALSGPAGGLPGGIIDITTQLVIDEPDDGSIHSQITGEGQLVKTGPGVARILRPNTYEGGNLVLEGTLLLESDQSGVFESASTVAAGAAFGGNGALGGELFAEAGSRIVPGGEGEIGTFIAFDGGEIAGSLEIDFDAGDSDRLDVFLGTLDISEATLDLRLADGATPEAESYVIIQIGGDAALAGEFAEIIGMPEGYSLSYGSGNGSVSLVRDSTAGDGFADWIAGFEGIAAEDAGPFADADGSGTANILEFVLNGDPTDPSANGLQAVWMEAEAAGNPLRLTIAVPRGTMFEATPGGPQAADIDGFVVQVEGSGNLASFHLEVTHLGSADEVPQSGLPSLASEDWEYHTFGLDEMVDRAFMRISADD